MAKRNTLHDVRVGDLLAPISNRIRSEPSWTGVLRPVTKVTPKRVFMGTTQIDKDTGREPGGFSSSYYVVATPEMLEEHARKEAEREEGQRKADSFRAREEHAHASAICLLLENMTPDNHPLDRLTPEEWRSLRKRLCP